MGFFLHELIPLDLATRYPNLWRREQKSGEKDIVCLTDSHYSIEIKTSSNPESIFGNRSYAQTTQNTKKDKSGYYLAINFEKFTRNKGQYQTDSYPKILLIRFGWLDHSDWMGQKAPSGQQARLDPNAIRYKMISIPLTTPTL